MKLLDDFFGDIFLSKNLNVGEDDSELYQKIARRKVLLKHGSLSELQSPDFYRILGSLIPGRIGKKQENLSKCLFYLSTLFGSRQFACAPPMVASQG